MQTKVEYDYQYTVHNCPEYCHTIIEYNDGKRVEEFYVQLTSIQGRPVTCLAVNTSEFVQENGQKVRKKYSKICYQGYELGVLEDTLIPCGAISLPASCPWQINWDW